LAAADLAAADAELAAADANAQRDRMRLEAKTAEIDAAKQQAVIAQQTAHQQAAAWRMPEPTRSVTRPLIAHRNCSSRI